MELGARKSDRSNGYRHNIIKNGLLNTESTSNTSAASSRKRCKHPQCEKINAGGGLCVSHGGGRKCLHPGCKKGAQKGSYCRGHGGGSRCSHPLCSKVDAGGGFCRGHGGGKRCNAEGCSKADVGGGFCTAHGGGKRCSRSGCTKNSQSHGLCRAHGGGKRCKEDGCDRSCQGRSGYCLRHGKRQTCERNGCRRVPVQSSNLCSRHVYENLDMSSDGEGSLNRADEHQTDGNANKEENGEISTISLKSKEDVEKLSLDVVVLDGQTPVSCCGNSSIKVAEKRPTRIKIKQSSCCSGKDSNVSRLTELVVGEVYIEPRPSAADVSSCCSGGGMIANGCCRAFGGECNCQEGCPCRQTWSSSIATSIPTTQA